MPSIVYLEKQRQAFSTHQLGTGEWFLSHTDFKAWRDGEQPSILLGRGIQGAGKTVLTSLAIDNVSKHHSEKDTQIAYLYCDYRDQSKETVPVLLSSILRQLLTPERLIFPFVREKCFELCTKYATPNILVREHTQLIRILAQLSRRTYIFVDAIDEVAESGPNGEDVRHMFLTKLFGLSDLCRLFITCRPHIDTGSIEAPSPCRTVEIRAKDEDISAYVASTITAPKTLREFVERDPELKGDIIDAVQHKANGV
jgi:Cdc6-like AAA superfamily ATPase